jgi:3',5'-cyclic-AMP phosphodiesterase
VTGAPFLLAQLSDPHVNDEDEIPAGALARVVGEVAGLDPAPGAVLVTGDLAEHGRAGEYERVRELLAPLAMPVHVLGGNHDDAHALRAAFPAGEPGDDYRYATRCGPLRLVVCDTTRAGRDDGHLPPDRLAWLEATLAEEPETPTIVAMHHLPLETGIAAADALGIAAGERAGLADVIARHPQIRRILTGHVHRPVVGEIGGCPVFACPSAYAQGALDLTGSEQLALTDEPPAFALHLAREGEIVSHLAPVDR